MASALTYNERWVLGYLRAHRGEVNTAPSVGTALRGIGVWNRADQTARYTLRKLERRGLAVREAVGGNVVLWEAL